MIRVLVFRILKLLVRLKYLREIYEFSYVGKIFSLNDLYRQGHWSVRSSLKNKYKKIFSEMLKEAEVLFCNKFYLIVFYNTRHDPDNIVGVIKVLVDSMKGKLIPDDNKKYFKGLAIFPDSTLSPGTVQFILIEKANEN
jgi:hypothetical protein